ncbi:MAG: TonB-dependent receptor [Vicinamibacterales bacterium]
MRHRLVGWMAALVCVIALTLHPTPAFAQGGTTSTLSGIVIDSAGAVVPGADVVIQHNATGVTTTGVSNEQGAFSFPGLPVGTYTVTVTLTGFKKFVANDVLLTSGAPGSVKAVMELGGVEETITVSSASEIVQTQSTTISATINSSQILKLPLTTRAALDFVTFLPGVITPGGNRQSMINGLPQGMINITLDGVNVQDNTLRSTDGFFAIVNPRLDAIEEVTVTTAAQGSDSAQGAVQIKFVTRSGTNTFSGGGYHYYRSDKLNANTWFNNRGDVDKPKLKQNQAGFRVGGPIVIPRLFNGRNRAFFFVNFEEVRQPNDVSRNRTILKPDAQQGIFRYTAAGGVQQVNLLALAAANGQTATTDPMIAALLTKIRTATDGGSIEDIDVNLNRFRFNVPTESLRRYPTFRIDYNITDKHRFSSAYNYQYFTDYPDTLNNHDASFPGFTVAAGQKSERLSFANSLRSTLSQNLVNEARVGYSGAPVKFFDEYTAGMFSDSSLNQGGYRLSFPTVNTALTSPSPAPAPQSRDANSLQIENTLTWLRGNHSFSMGGSWTQFDLWMKNSNLVPRIEFDVVNGDPALTTMFTAANFPGASSDNVTAARRLYALLVGRISRIDGDVRLSEATNEYEYMGIGTQRARMREAGIFFQDSWRVRPNLTINAGLRYELQFPFSPLNSSYSTATMEDLCGVSGVNAQGTCNLFQAGIMPGKRPEFINFGKGTPAYDTDYDNFAPSVGAAWTLRGPSGLARLLTGDELVVRAGYTRAFNRNGMNDFSGQYNGNPGVLLSGAPDRDPSLGTLNDGQGLPLLLRQTARLSPAVFPTKPVYPMTDVVTEDINLFYPGIQVPWADSWSAGIQRSISSSMAVEIRYVGTRSRDNWQVLNYNEVNVIENGFLNEFRQAQANLQAHVAAGCGGTGNPCSFAYRGPGTGTAPLPIFLAYFNAQGSTQAGNAAAYAGTNWTNTTFQAFLAARNPNPIGMVYNTTNNTGTGITNNATLRQNALNAGLAANFFVANPHLIGGADLTTNNGQTDYNGLQLELRRRYAQGLQFQASYAFGKSTTSRFETFRRGTFMVRDPGSPGDLTHAVKGVVVYDLPFGQGRRFGGNVNGFVDRVIGGWSVGWTARIQSGQLVDLGNVRLVGMSTRDVEKMFKLHFDDAGKKIWMLPQDVIDESIKAFSVNATAATGYGTLGPPSGRYFAPANGPDCIEPDADREQGECGVRTLVVTGPMFRQHDVSVAKRVRLFGRSDVEFRIEALNVFNQANFVPVGGIGTNRNSYEVTGLTGTNTSRTIQLVSRINW